MLRILPAVVRKWWQNKNPRQASLLDKITTNFVSSQLCQEELRALIDKKEKHENMNIKVHPTSREVHATYSIDEARMELIITLPINHPLGAVKVESGRQIGGRVQARDLVMQLTLFLTHQNGSIMDGLSLWKRNLDRKFEGVEECFICYSVLHQDTCKLPHLSCKTCKKKFHGPCLVSFFYFCFVELRFVNFCILCSINGLVPVTSPLVLFVETFSRDFFDFFVSCNYNVRDFL